MSGAGPAAPRVTVLMSMHDGERFLRETLDSVAAQSFRDFELLVIDDGSTDRGPDILRGYADRRLRVVRQERTGLTRALNRGLALARGAYVARMDADDVALPDRLRRQVAYLDARPDVALLGSWADVIDDRGRRLERARPPVAHDVIRAQLLWDNAFLHSTILFRAAVVRSLGGYDERFARSQDYDLAWRVGRVARLANLAAPLLRWRRSATAISVRHRDEQRRAAGEIAYRNLAEHLGRQVDAEWFWRLRRLWDGDRDALPAGDVARLAALLDELPEAAGRTVWIEFVALAAAARRGEAGPLLAAAWRRFRHDRPRLLHPKRVARIALGTLALRAGARLRRRTKGY